MKHYWVVLLSLCLIFAGALKAFRVRADAEHVEERLNKDSNFLSESSSRSNKLLSSKESRRGVRAFAEILESLSKNLDLDVGVNTDLFESSPRRSLLSDSKHDIYIVAGPDGTLHFTDMMGNALWTLSTGPAISNMYQDAPDSDNDSDATSTLLLDALMEHPYERYIGLRNAIEENSEHGKMFVLQELMKKIGDYVISTPHISRDGITLGEKKTTIFLIDIKDGSLVDAFKLGAFPPRLGSPSDNNALSEKGTKKLSEHTPTDPETVQLLYISRTDYLLQSYAPISKKVLWNLTISEFQAHFHHSEKKMQLPVLHLYPRDLLQFLFEMVGLNHEETKSLPAPEINGALVIDVNEDPHNMPLAIDGSAEENSAKSLPASETNSAFVVARNEDPKFTPVAIDDSAEENSSFRTITSHINQHLLKIMGILVSFSMLVSWYRVSVAARSKKSAKLNDSNGKHTMTPKRKKARKLGNHKNEADGKKMDRSSSSEEGEQVDGVSKNESGARSRMIGKLFLSDREIAKGSNGTVVLEGEYDGRQVAVKRLVKVHHDVAYKEIQHLIASDRHPNIVRWYGVESDSNFVYLSLERCTCSLNDLIQICSASSQQTKSTKGKTMNSVNGYNIQLDLVKEANKDVQLWKSNGYPSTQLLKLMRGVVSGLAHLHDLGIIHRDLKPQNILILEGERSLSAKISDMGISKRLDGDKSSIGHHPTGCGSSGWQAPEQLLHERQTRAVDLFSLGCVLFFCMTGGKHPYGDHLERDINIVKNRVDLFMVEHIPEAMDLFSRLLRRNPESRPMTLDVVHHPFFWSSEMRLSFLREASDRVECEDRKSASDILKALESVAPLALGGKWDEKMEATFLTNIGSYRRYNYDSTRDLLRVMRNKYNHYRELPTEIQELLGPIPEGFDGYFASRFPKFLIEMYKVVDKYCREEEWFSKYCKNSSA